MTTADQILAKGLAAIQALEQERMNEVKQEKEQKLAYLRIVLEEGMKNFPFLQGVPIIHNGDDFIIRQKGYYDIVANFSGFYVMFGGPHNKPIGIKPDKQKWTVHFYALNLRTPYQLGSIVNDLSVDPETRLGMVMSFSKLPKRDPKPEPEVPEKPKELTHPDEPVEDNTYPKWNGKDVKKMMDTLEGISDPLTKIAHLLETLVMVTYMVGE
jgi:hypothetical protein